MQNPLQKQRVEPSSANRAFQTIRIKIRQQRVLEIPAEPTERDNRKKDFGAEYEIWNIFEINHKLVGDDNKRAFPNRID